MTARDPAAADLGSVVSATATVDCPALHRRNAAHYPFGNRVPKTVRLKTTVKSDWQVVLVEGRELRAPQGACYPAWTNSYGAVSAVLPDGSKLGLYPREFEIVEWHSHIVEAP